MWHRGVEFDQADRRRESSDLEAKAMPDGDRKPFHPISEHAGREWMPWAYCLNEPACGHNARVDITAIIAKTGDMPSDEFRRRLKCPNADRAPGW
jgi:hypothetical protein